MSIADVTLWSKDSKGGVRTWEVWAEGDTIVTMYGAEEGEKQFSRKRCAGKNIGKANETTPEQQAQLEIQSMVSKQLRKKYCESRSEALKFRLKPMLAHGWDKHKHKLQWPADVQPKLDGYRCLAEIVDGEVVLHSRGGKTYYLPHIAKAVKEILPENIVLDGELYAEGVLFNTVASWIKRDQEDTPRVCFHVYDIYNKHVPGMSWQMRKLWLRSLQARPHPLAIKLVPTETVADETDALRVAAEHVANGCEGGIVRAHKATYKVGGRSDGLLKLKTFIDEEFEVLGAEEGRGKFSGCAIWICKTKPGSVKPSFKATPVGTFEERAAMWDARESFFGRQLTVKHFGISEDGRPRHPIALRFRDEKDLPC